MGLGWLLISLVVAAAPAWATVRVTVPGMTSDWYRSLRKPWFHPPGWLIGPVTGLLYTAMAIAAWLVVRRGSLPALYCPQLALHVLWSGLLFGRRMVGPAFITLLMLLAVSAATVCAFWQVDALAGALLLPYLSWMIFAAIVHGLIWIWHRAPT